MGFFSKIKEGLKKTSNAVQGAVDNIIKNFTKVDEELFEELEETLISCDIGVNTSLKICSVLRERVKEQKVTEPQLIKGMLREIIEELMDGDYSLNLSTKPSVIMVIGVNGVGKTTSIGKIAARLKGEGKEVMLGAADTFRAAAIEQLTVWSERSGAKIVAKSEGTDPAAVVFDTLVAARKYNSDVIICDTAGRLHNKKNLMEELAKMSRIIKRELPDASVESLLVLDAATGQNAVNQAREFAKVTDITGIILTKLDGTAKGGVVLAIKDELKIPVKFIGVGEQIDDLQPFDPKEFTAGLFGDNND
ncbi:MAG: signal recognition particle-docking protein FtsY [Clostridia bacterium]|nr:signal recognition particle-docking protein FtsY [Clostridia bacterium]